LEINYSPSLTCDAPVDKKIKSGVLIEAMLLANINIKNR